MAFGISEQTYVLAMSQRLQAAVLRTLIPDELYIIGGVETSTKGAGKSKLGMEGRLESALIGGIGLEQEPYFGTLEGYGVGVSAGKGKLGYMRLQEEVTHYPSLTRERTELNVVEGSQGHWSGGIWRSKEGHIGLFGARAWEPKWLKLKQGIESELFLGAGVAWSSFSSAPQPGARKAWELIRSLDFSRRRLDQ